MTGLDEEEVLAAAVATDAVVLMERTPGASLVAGTPVVFPWPIAPGQRLDAERVEQLQRQVAGAVSVRFEHTAAQDITYGLRQLTDVANKALSQGINDPTTANHAIAHTSGLLCTMVAHDLGPWMLRDDGGRVRVIMCRPRTGGCPSWHWRERVGTALPTPTCSRGCSRCFASSPGRRTCRPTAAPSALSSAG